MKNETEIGTATNKRPRSSLLALLAPTAVEEPKPFDWRNYLNTRDVGRTMLDCGFEMLIDLNQYRVANGRSPLAINGYLQLAAAWKARDMAVNDYFAHQDSLGREPWETMAACGYDFNTWKGENIAFGFGTVDAVLQAWKNSPGHNANLLQSAYKACGLAVWPRPDGMRYWVQMFGGVA